jgi:CDP-4-dehydro-6-deoxyglucose reductase, E1
MEYRRVFYAEANYGQEEIDAVVEVLQTQRHSMVTGKNVDLFEKRTAEIFGKKYGLMVNSGSSANLVAIQSLELPEGGEVITPALTFSTTISPIVQSGLVPVFTDSMIDNLQVNIDEVEASITDKTVAFMIPNLIGNIPDWARLREIADKHNLFLIEDSADTIGYKIDGEFGNKYSDITTSSFYASHIITGAGTGGIVCYNNLDLLQKGRSLRSWGRRSSQYGETEEIERRLDCSLDGFDYDDKYVFDDIGYNFIPSEISAAFALKQFDKLEKNISIRQRNFDYMKEAFSKHNDKVITFNSLPNIDITWLAFPIVLTGLLAGKRKKLQQYMEGHGIQTRTIFTGNITRHPMMDDQKYTRATSDFSIVDQVMANGILLGCHNSLEIDDLAYMIHYFEKFLKTL